MISDFIDILNSDRIAGWCFNSDPIDEPVVLSFHVDQLKLGEVIASADRPDLKALEFHPTGRCGFEFVIPEDIDVRQYQTLRIYAKGNELPIKEVATASIPTVLRTRHRKLFFMHIPKTAGTSFNTFAETLFPKDSTAVHIESLDVALYQELQNTKQYIAGHLPFREIKANFDLDQFDLITILREPYSHLHSHLKWVRNIGAIPESDFFKAHSGETQELAILLNQLDFSISENLQKLVNGICGDLTSLFDNHQTRYFLDYRRIRVEEGDLGIATKELKNFLHIGQTEDYVKTVDFVYRHFRLDNSPVTEKLNYSTGANIFDLSDEKVRDALYPFVKYDLALYRYLFQ